MKYTTLILLAVVSLWLPACVQEPRLSKEGATMADVIFPTEITIKEMFDGSVRMEPAENYPTPVYYFKKGERVDDESQADEIVPVVEVQIFSLDAQGKLVEPAQAMTMRIVEYGANELFLQSTTANIGK